jgi:hypothetical protein
MLEEITLSVDDRQGLLAEIGELLGTHGVNIETFSATSRDGIGVVHLVVEDDQDAAEILASNGFEVEASREVMSTTLDDRPGELGAYCRRLSEAGVRISAAYLMRRSGGETELIFAVDDLGAAQTAG